MDLKTSINNYLFKIFKIATIAHLILTLLAIIINYFFPVHNAYYMVTTKSITMTSMVTSILITIKSIHFFMVDHKNYLIKHSITAFVIQSIVFIISFFVIFINKRITNQFILFMSNLSTKVYGNKLTLLIILIVVYLNLELYEVFKTTKRSIKNRSIREIIRSHLTDLILKLIIVFGSFVAILNPVAMISEEFEIQQFNSLIYRQAIKYFFQYMHIALIAFVIISITRGIHFVYKDIIDSKK